MLGSNYLTYGEIALPNPASFSISFQNAETVKQSISGKDLSVATRLQKRTFTCSFNCTSGWLEKIKAICNESSGYLTYGGESVLCRARIASQTLAPDSEHVNRTDGLWTISVTFTEV